MSGELSWRNSKLTIRRKKSERYSKVKKTTHREISLRVVFFYVNNIRDRLDQVDIFPFMREVQQGKIH